MASDCSAILSADGASFRIRRDAWFNDYPLADLPFWIAFYKRLRDQHPKALHSYDATIAALEDLARRLPA